MIAGRPVDALTVEGCTFRGSEKSSGILASDVPSSRRSLVTLIDCTSEGHFGWGAVGKAGAVIELRGGRYCGAHGGLRAVGHGLVLANDVEVHQGPIGLSAADGGTILAENLRASGELTDAARVDTKGAIRWRGGQLEASRAFSVSGDGWLTLAQVDATTHGGALEIPWGNALIIDCKGLDRTDDSTTVGYGTLWVARGSAPEPTVGDGGAVVRAVIDSEAPREDWRSLGDAVLRGWIERLSELGFDPDDATIGKVIAALGWAVDDGAPRSTTLEMAHDNAGWFDQLALFALLDPTDPPKAPSPKRAKNGAMLSELEALIAEADGHPVVMRPGASPEAIAAAAEQLGLDALPPELEVWFAWHDGQDRESKGRFKPGYDNRPLSLEEMTQAWLAATSDPEHVPPVRPSQLPLLETKNGFIAVDIEGDRHWPAGALVEVRRGDRDVKDQFECFAEWLEGVLMRRRAEVGSRELSIAAPDPVPSVAQQVVLATAAQLLTRNNDRADVLGGVRPVVGTPRAYHQLRYWWDIYTTGDARSTIDGLLEEGRSQLDDGARDTEVAWTLGRAAFVAGTAYAALLIECDEAWKASLAAARMLRERFDSWEAFGDAYNAARIEWSGGLSDEARTASDAVAEVRGPFDRAYARLLTEGAWSRLPWELPDEDPPCPASATPSTTWRVTPNGGDDTSTLDDAFRQAQPGDRLELSAGHYRGGQDVVGYVTVVGVEEGVVIDSPIGDSCLNVLGGFLSLENVTLRAARRQRGAGRYALRVGSGTLYANNCRLLGEDIGLLHYGGCVRLVDCEVVGRDNVSLQADGGTALAAERCEIHSAALINLQLCGPSQQTRLAGCTIRDGHKFGIGAYEDAKVEAVDCSIRGHWQHNVVVHSPITLTECRLLQSGRASCHVEKNGVLRLLGCELRDNQGSNVFSQHDGVVEMRGCKSSGSPGSGLMLDMESRGRVVGCELFSCNTAALYVRGEGAKCVVASSRLAESPIGAGVIVQHGDVHMVDCLVERNATEGLLATQEAHVVVARSKFANSHTGMTAQGSRVDLRDVAIEKSNWVGVNVTDGGAVQAAGLQIEGGSEACLFAYNARATVVQGRLVAEGDHAVVAAEGSVVALGDVVVQGGDEGSIDCRDDGKIVVSACEDGRGKPLQLSADHALVLAEGVEVPPDFIDAVKELEGLRKLRQEELAEREASESD